MANEGSTLGSILGGIAGTLIAPGAGTAIGAGIGGQLGAGVQNLVDGKATPPPQEDPQQSNFLNFLKNKINSNMTGSEFNGLMKEIQTQAKATQEGLIGTSGGASGSLQNALIRSQQAAGDTENRGYAQSLEGQKFFGTMAQQLIDKMASRKFDIDNYKYTSALAGNAQNQKMSSENINAGLADINPSGTNYLSNILKKKKQSVMSQPSFDPNYNQGDNGMSSGSNVSNDADSNMLNQIQAVGLDGE